MNKSLQIIQTSFTATFVLVSVVSAAQITISPNSGMYQEGDTIDTKIFIEPGSGESITAVGVDLSIPVDRFEILSYTPINANNILANVGTNVDKTSGKVNDNFAFNPALNNKQAIANLRLKVISSSESQIAVGSDTKILNEASENILATGVGAQISSFEMLAENTEEESPIESPSESDIANSTDVYTEPNTPQALPVSTPSYNPTKKEREKNNVNKPKVQDDKNSVDKDQNTVLSDANAEEEMAQYDSYQDDQLAKIAESGKKDSNPYLWLLLLLILILSAFGIRKFKK